MGMNPIKMMKSGDKSRKKMSKKGWKLSKEGQRRTSQCGLLAGLTTGISNDCPDPNDAYGNASYSGDPSWVGGTTKLKSGGLVTKGSNKEQSRLIGNFNIY